MRELMRRVWHAMRRRQFEADLAEELEFHRDMRQREIEADGAPPEEAAVRTRRAMGSAPLAADHARDVWIAPWLRDIAQDIRFAARLLLKDRRFTIAAVLALGLGIGANNTVFTLVNTLLLRDLPFDQPDRLVTLGTRNEKGRTLDLSYEEIRDWRASATSFAAIGGSTHGGAMIVSGEARPAERYRGQYISANLFGLLRRAPILGRDFLPEDERPGAPAVVLIGHAMWQSRYGSDPTAVGRTIRVNEQPAIIVGIMPPRFTYSFTSEMWMPLAHWPDLSASVRGGPTLDTIARLADNAQMASARADVQTIVTHDARAYPATHAKLTGHLEPMNQGAMRASSPMLMTLMGAVAFVLLIACANVANLLLTRAVQRGREMAIRASLGATRWRLVRQLLIECLLLSAIAGLVGLLISFYGVRFLGVAFDAWEGAAPAQAATPYWVNLSMNGPVLLFLTGVVLATALIFGLAPAWHVSKTNTNALLKEDGRGSAGSRRARRLTSAFMIAEVALTLVLLTGAGLLARSFFALYAADSRVDTPSRLLVMRLALPESKYATPAARARFYATLEDGLTMRSAMGAAALATHPPLESGGRAEPVAIDGRAPESSTAPASSSSIAVTAGYFDTLGLRATRGRLLDASDAARGHEGAVVNERFAAMFFPTGNPVGQRIRLGTPLAASSTAPAADGAARNQHQTNARDASAASPWLTIVGVVPNLPRMGPRRDPEPLVYAPLRTVTAPGSVMTMVARADGGMTTRVDALREQLLALDADVPLYSIETMSSVLARGRKPQELIGGFLGAIAGIALLLAAVGLYALTAHGVTQRTQEIGIRMALGARAPQVIWLFARRTLVHLAIGVSIGLAGALAVGKLLQSLLVGLPPRDPLTLVTVTLLLITVALAAAWMPARRAARLDPIAALRDD